MAQTQEGEGGVRDLPILSIYVGALPYAGAQASFKHVAILIKSLVNTRPHFRMIYLLPD